jgi:hypothetical protein
VFELPGFTGVEQQVLQMVKSILEKRVQALGH